MSIRYIVGNPGSGKSYYGVKVLYDAFIRPRRLGLFEFYEAYKKGDFKSLDKSKNETPFNVAYTNINEFKFDLNPKIKKFEFNQFFNDLTLLYYEYKKPDIDDTRLNKKAQELGLYKALFVIDEVHNFFEKDNEVLKWWLTYHRHLYQELYFITQDLSLVSTEFKSVAECFYKAVDSSKRFFSKKFRYIEYSSYKLYQKDIISKFHVDFEQEIFNLYHSGNNGLGKSAVKKFMWFGILLVLIVFILFKILISVFLTPDEVEKIDEVKATKQDTNTTFKPENFSKTRKELEKAKENKDENFYYQFSCFNYQCSFKNSTDLFEQTLLELMLNKSEVLYKGSRTHTKGLVTWTYLVKGEVFKPLKIKYLNDERKKGKTDEKDSFELGSFGFKP